MPSSSLLRLHVTCHNRQSKVCQTVEACRLLPFSSKAKLKSNGDKAFLTSGHVEYEMSASGAAPPPLVILAVDVMKGASRHYYTNRCCNACWIVSCRFRGQPGRSCPLRCPAIFTKRSSSPIPVTTRSKARVCGGSLCGIAGSNPAGGTDVCHVSVLCCLSEVSALV